MSSKLRWYCPYCGLWQPDTDACTRYDGQCAFPPIRHEPPEAEKLSERVAEANDEALRQGVSENEDVRKYLALKALAESLRAADSGTKG